MANVKKLKDGVVKIDSGILLEIEEFINKKENRLKYVNKKQLVDIAVSEFLIRGDKQKRGKNG